MRPTTIPGLSVGGWLALAAAMSATPAAGQPRAYVSNEGSNDVSVINTTTDMEIRRPGVGRGPRPLEASPNGRWVYVANHGESPNTISIIDTADDSVSPPITAGMGPTRVGFSGDSRCAYAVNEGSNDITVIDTASRTVLGTMAAGLAPRPGAATPGGQYGIVLNQGSNDVWVYDLGGSCLAGAPVAQIPVDITPEGALVTPDGAYLYVIGFGSDVVVIDLRTFTVVTTVPVEQPSGGDINSNGKVLFVSSAVSNSVFVIDIDPASDTFNTVVNTFLIGDVPLNGGFFRPDGRMFIVGNVAGQVFEIDTDPQSPTYGSIICSFTLSGLTGDDRAAITRNGATMYVTNRLSNSVISIDVSACGPRGAILVGTNPTHLTVTPF